MYKDYYEKIVKRITEQIRKEDSIKSLDYYIYHDNLTGLPNKTSLMEDPPLYFNCIKENPVIIAIDINHFKLISDSMGPNFADELLQNVASRLNKIFGAGNVYRIDEAEYVVIYDHNSGKDLSESLTLVFSQLKKPYEIRRSKMYINVSMGVAPCRNGEKTPQEYLECAQRALEDTQRRGRNGFLIYKEYMDELVKEKMQIEKLLHKAVENREFEVYYQPQMILESGKISGFEALLRWNSPELGFVYPDQFIRIAEENRLIIPIGEFVLKKACSFLKKLHRIGYKNLSIAVNVSNVQLLNDGFINGVLDILEKTGLNPDKLVLEMTEEILTESYDMVKEKLISLKQKGIKIAMDDFGKNYSTLDVLSRLPINTLKIDKVFIENFLQDKPKQLITDLIISIGKKMGFEVLAEGVETREQYEYLKNMKI